MLVSNFQTQMNDRYLEHLLPQYLSNLVHQRLVNIGSGNGLVPSGNKSLPEPMLT